MSGGIWPDLNAPLDEGVCRACGGHFPGQGVERGEYQYCCDVCADGARARTGRMLLRLAPLALALVGAGMLLGRATMPHPAPVPRDEPLVMLP